MTARRGLALAFTLTALSMAWWWPLASMDNPMLDRDLAILSLFQLLILLGGWALCRPGKDVLGLSLTAHGVRWTWMLGLGLLCVGLILLSLQGPWRLRTAMEVPGRESLAWTALYTILLGPLFEEFCFRSHIQGEVEAKLGKWGGLIVVFVVFIACHAEADLTLLLGAVGMGFLRAKTGSVWPAVALHMAGNAFIIGSHVFLMREGLG